MRLREIPLLLITPLALAAALIAHALLKAFADLGLGASSFASHAHTAFEPVSFVEIALTLWLSGVALRDALTTRTQPYYKITPYPRLGFIRLTVCAGLVAFIATAALFGMEYCESGSAAFGLGWLGGSLLPGAVALTIALAGAVGALYLALTGHFAGLAHLIALFAAALARAVAALLTPPLTPQTFTSRRLTPRSTPVARHAGLRAPPTSAR